MRVLLVQPHTPGTENWTPPLGLGYLAAALRNDGCDVEIADLNARGDEAIGSIRARAADADLIGITTNMANFRTARALADELEDGMVVFGGPQASARAEVFVTRPKRFAMSGEGEVSLPMLARALREGRSLAGIPGLTYLDADGVTRRNARGPLVREIDSLPMPAWDLLDMSRYEVSLLGRRATSLISSRGCPFDCFFCYHDFQGKVYRTHSVQRVLDEIDLLQGRHGIGAFFFYDDNFTLDENRLRSLCEALVEQRRDVVWRCYSRVSSVHPELLDLMRRAGCVEIVFGVESGSQATLDRIRKRTRVEEAVRAVRLCREAGIASKSYVMIGFPWETKDDIRRTIDFLDELLPSQVMLVIATPFAGTPFEQDLVDAGIAIDPNIDITGIAEPAFETSNWTRDELRELRDLGYEKIRRGQDGHLIEYQWKTAAHWQRQFERAEVEARPEARPDLEERYTRTLEQSWQADSPLGPPLQAVLGVTHRCDSRCTYCEVWRFDRAGEDPSSGDLADVLRQVRALGCERVNLSGGEPLLRSDLETIIAAGTGAGLAMGMITNGLSLTARRLVRLREAGLRFVSLSLDTIEPEDYAAVRGVDASRALATLQLLAHEQRGPDWYTAILAVLTPRNIDAIPGLIEHCEEHRLLLQLQPAQPFSSEHESSLRATGLLLAAEHVPQLESIARRLEKSSCSINSGRFLHEIISFVETGRSDRTRHCYAAYAALSIDASLEVRPCWRFPAAGSLRESKLLDIWHGNAFRDARRKMRARECDDCLLICHADRVRSLAFTRLREQG